MEELIYPERSEEESHHDNVFTVLDMLLECAAPDTQRERERGGVSVSS